MHLPDQSGIFGSFEAAFGAGGAAGAAGAVAGIAADCAANCAIIAAIAAMDASSLSMRSFSGTLGSLKLGATTVWPFTLLEYQPSHTSISPPLCGVYEFTLAC